MTVGFGVFVSLFWRAWIEALRPSGSAIRLDP